MSTDVTHWDPFSGTISISTPDTSTIRRGVALPIWLKRLPLAIALLGLLWTMVAAIFGGGFPFIPVAVTTLAFAAIFLFELVENVDGRKTLRRVRLARDRGWSYTGKLMEWPIEHTRSVSISVNRSDPGVDRRTRRVKPERLLKIEARIPELTKVQAGAFMGVRLDGEFWGESEADALPLWIAVGSMQMEAGLGTRKMREDSRGGTGGYGQFFSLVGAYQLDRKTGVRAAVSPEGMANKGPFDRDIKTESVQFNEAFHVTGRVIDDGTGTRDATHDVLRILSPATQASMLDLKSIYHNVGFLIEDDILFFMAQDNLVGENASEGGIDRLLPQILAEFESAKFSIKGVYPLRIRC